MFSVFIESFFLLFIAELGDKTQLVVLTLASKGYSSKKLAIGASIGFAAIVALGGVIAVMLNSVLELSWINFISGSIFIIIAIFQIVSILKNNEELSSDNQEDLPKEKDFLKKIKSSYLIGFLAIFFMELGDKTQVMTIILTMNSPYPLITLFGAWLALSFLALIGALFGEKILKKLPQKLIDWIASIIFFLIGVIMIFSAL